MIAFGEALEFQDKIGRAAIEQRSRALAQQLIAGLAKIDGVRLWTSTAPDRSAAVVSFLPGSLDKNTLAAALYERDRIAITTRGGSDRPGIRVSPHFYNSPQEVDSAGGGRGEGDEERRVATAPRSTGPGGTGWAAEPRARPAYRALANRPATALAGSALSDAVIPSRHAAWPITCAALHPARRRSAMPVSPSDLLSFCVGDFISRPWCRKTGGTARPSRRATRIPASGRGEQVGAPDYQADGLGEIVDGHRELVGPVAEAIANQQVTGLRRRVLGLRPERGVVEGLDAGIDRSRQPWRSSSGRPRSRHWPP